VDDGRTWTTDTGTHGQDLRPAVEKRLWLNRRTEAYALDVPTRR
jgi:hypothetical protein